MSKIRFDATTAPEAPPTGKVVLFVDTDGKTKQKNSAGTVTDLTASATGLSSVTHDETLSGEGTSSSPLSAVSQTDNNLTNALKTNYDAAYTHVSSTSNPHSVTKSQVGLGSVPDTDFTTPVANNTAHREIVTGNPHSVTKSDVGLGNVPNLDFSNASNITAGTLPSSVLPPVALTKVEVYSSEVDMLAATAEEGDVGVRSDLNKTYMRNAGIAGDMADWTELRTPTDSVISVNSKTGAVSLTQDDVGDGSTYVRTQNDLTDTLKTNYDGAVSHVSSTSNPHSVTASQVGLGTTDAASFGSVSTTGNIVAGGQAYSATNTLTDATTITPDFDAGNVQTVTLAGNRTLANPSNLKDGATYIVIVKQDATGSRTLSYGTAYKWPGGSPPVLTTTASAVDILTFVSDGTVLYGVVQGDFR